jgi:hypothetical protein
MRLFQRLFSHAKPRGKGIEPTGRVGRPPIAPSSTEPIREEVQLSPMWRDQWFEGKHATVQLQGPPEKFFAQEELPPLWPNDPNHVAKYGKDQRYLRTGWYIAYLHHPDPRMVVRTLKAALNDKQPDAASNLSVYLPEVLTHTDSQVREAAATLAWRCDDASLKYVFTTLTSTGAIPSGFSPGKAKLAIELLKKTCPVERRNFLLDLLNMCLERGFGPI